MQPPFVSHPDPIPLDAARAALGAAEPGWVFWNAEPKALDCVVVIEPEPEAARIGRQALCDALGALGPPQGVLSTEGEAVLVNGARAATVSLDMPGADIGLLVVRVDMADPDDPDPGLHPDRTTLREEGYDPEVDGVVILGAFLRHLLYHAYRAEKETAS